MHTVPLQPRGTIVVATARAASQHDAATPAAQVARCTKIINPGADDAKYVINVKQIAKARTRCSSCICAAGSLAIECTAKPLSDYIVTMPAV